MTLTCFVYYRIAPGAAPSPGRVAAMLTDLQRECGVAGRLMRRTDDPFTWMEVYENIADAARFEEALARLVGRHALESLLLPGSRRVIERFETVPTVPQP